MEIVIVKFYKTYFHTKDNVFLPNWLIFFREFLRWKFKIKFLLQFVYCTGNAGHFSLYVINMYIIVNIFVYKCKAVYLFSNVATNVV